MSVVVQTRGKCALVEAVGGEFFTGEGVEGELACFGLGGLGAGQCALVELEIAVLVGIHKFAFSTLHHWFPDSVPVDFVSFTPKGGVVSSEDNLLRQKL